MSPLLTAHLRPVYDALLAVRRDRALLRWRLGLAIAFGILVVLYMATGWFFLPLIVVLAIAAPVAHFP